MLALALGTALACTGCAAPVKAGPVASTAPADHHGTILLFISSDCPISNSYQPELERLRAKYEPQGISFLGIYAELPISNEEVQKHSRDFGLKYPVMIDKDMTLRKHYGIRVVPEVVLIDGADFAKGTPLYEGRIDDWYPERGTRRAEPQVRDLERTLDEFIAGKPVSTPRTAPVGCVLPK